MLGHIVPVGYYYPEHCRDDNDQTMRLIILSAVSAAALCAQSNTASSLTNTNLSSSVCFPNQGSGSAATAPYSDYPFNSLCTGSGLYTPWSSGTVDTRRHRVLFFGGGHTDNHSNEVHAYYYSAATPYVDRKSVV